MNQRLKNVIFSIGLISVLVGCNSNLVKLPTTFLVIDLDKNGIEGIGYQESQTYFDMDGDGVKEKTGWLTKEDGFLVLDANLNGSIDDLAEMLVDPTQTRHAKLLQHDSDGDGKITSTDTIWKKLLVWQDRDSDGSADDGELKKLDSLGVAALELEVKSLGASTATGIDITGFSQSVFADGRATEMYEAQFYTTKDFDEYEKNKDR
jgi:hypothetical protein